MVRLDLNPHSWHGATSEGLWTRLVESLVGRAVVEIDNIPFFTKSVSLHDKISVLLSGANAIFETPPAAADAVA